MVVVEGAIPEPIVTGTATMLVVGILLEVFAVIGAIVTGATAWTRLAASPTAVSAGPGRPALS